MDFTGRPMAGFVQVAPAGFEDDADLRAWMARGVAYAVTQEKKPRAKAPKRTKPGAKKARAKKGGAARPAR
jgi:hypothetical protein